MIDESLLLQQLYKIREPLFIDHQKTLKRVYTLWQQCVAHKCTHEQLCAHAADNLTKWQELLETKKLIIPDAAYQVLAVDGSQVYPNRHDGIRVAVINIGGVWLKYDHVAQIQLFCEPFVLLDPVEEVSTAVVDCERHARELSYSVEKSMQYQKNHDKRLLVLFDGSLIFWHLQENSLLRERYFARYCAQVDQLRQENTWCAWYVSLPKSRDLVHLAQAYAGMAGEHDLFIGHCCDDDLMALWLLPYERTIIFESMVKLALDYPPLLRPYFFYINTGSEIARIEVPAWMAGDEKIIDALAAQVLDQCEKGDGYPISLALAHEQAVVKQQDRLLLQRFLFAMADEHAAPARISRKQLKKQSLTI